MIAEQLIMSFFGTAGFAILFNVPRSTLPQCGFIGMVGWGVYYVLLQLPVNPIVAALGASFVVAVTSELFSRVYKTPVIVFSVAGHYSARARRLGLRRYEARCDQPVRSGGPFGRQSFYAVRGDRHGAGHVRSDQSTDPPEEGVGDPPDRGAGDPPG
jgi:hypothetical protein